MRDEEGAKGGRRDHNDSDASFHELPEYLPGNIDGVGGGVYSRYLHNGGDDHYDGQTEGKPEGKLLLELNLYAPQKKDRDNDD